MQTEGVMGHLRRLCDVDVLLNAKLLPKDGYRATDLHMGQLLLAIDQNDCLLFNLISNEAPFVKTACIVPGAGPFVHPSRDKRNYQELALDYSVLLAAVALNHRCEPFTINELLDKVLIQV